MYGWKDEGCVVECEGMEGDFSSTHLDELPLRLPWLASRLPQPSVRNNSRRSPRRIAPGFQK